MNLNEALVFGKSRLVYSATPVLDARILLEDVTKLSHSQIIAYADIELDSEQEHLYSDYIKKAAAGMPIPYITGNAYFADLKLTVDSTVLIPRPETELLVNAAYNWIYRSNFEPKNLNVVDVGTGSGCIAISLAKRLPEVRTVAIDSEESSLLIAMRNAEYHKVQNRIIFMHGNLLDSIQVAPDLIVANLPYVADHEWSLVDDSVKWYEPASALRGGTDGLELISRLLTQAENKLAPGGALFLEIGWQQGRETRRIAQELFPQATVEVSVDYAGNDRLLSIENAC